MKQITKHSPGYPSALVHDASPVPFATLGLDARLTRAIGDLGFEQTTPVQSAVYPAVLEGTDVIGCAQTGTGKTIAFLLPLLQRLLTSPRRGPGTRLLVLAPTRELVTQIEDDVRGLVRHTRLSGVSVYGGVASGPQARALRDGVDVVIATPGRLLDHMGNRTHRFDNIDAVVLDEADRMLDMGFWPAVQRIVAALPEARQTLLFSATTSPDVMKAAERIMREPKLVRVGQETGLATTITHVKHTLRTDEKLPWLDAFLRKAAGPTLVFVRTKHRADKLTRRLATGGIRCAPLHGNRSQSQRTAAVDGFKAGKINVLVATDIAARGLDIAGIEHVVNFEVPATPDTYVHRAGRTGRAEGRGTAVTLVAPEESATLRTIERSLKLQLAQMRQSA